MREERGKLGGRRKGKGKSVKKLEGTRRQMAKRLEREEEGKEDRDCSVQQ